MLNTSQEYMTNIDKRIETEYKYISNEYNSETNHYYIQWRVFGDMEIDINVPYNIVMEPKNMLIQHLRPCFIDKDSFVKSRIVEFIFVKPSEIDIEYKKIKEVLSEYYDEINDCYNITINKLVEKIRRYCEV